MQTISKVLGYPLGLIMFACFALTGNYGASILIFAVVAKALLFPLSVSSQKNSIRLLKLQPIIDEIRQRYAGEKERINEEIYNLYEREHYSPLKGSIPLLVQLPVILGLINVMYNPLTHLLRLDSGVITQLATITNQILGVERIGWGEQLLIIDTVQNPVNLPILETIRASIPQFEQVIAAVQSVDLNFMGINLGMVPSFSNPSMLLLIPLFSGVSCLVLCLVQNTLSPAAAQQGKVSLWVTSLLLIGFSLYFTLVVPAGVGVYWIASNLLSIVVALLLNAMYNPKKEAGVARKPEKIKLSPQEKAEQRRLNIELKEREKKDYAAFMGEEGKQVVFYSASGGSYRFFQTLIEYLLAHTGIVIHYITNDPKDRLFQQNNQQMRVYYMSPNKLISAMLKMDADMVIMTITDFGKYHLKRSVVRQDIEYIHVLHVLASTHLILREGCVDHFDTIFCAGPHHVEEIRRAEQVYGLPKKRLVKFGFSVIDLLLDKYKTLPPKSGNKPQILLAPSWQIDNILDSCIDQIVDQLVGKGYTVIVRPHPEYVIRFPQKVKDLQNRFGHLFGEDFYFELDFSTNDSVYQSDILLTDWSNTAFEFCYTTKSPAIFINTPMKVMNPEYKKIDLDPLDITLRDRVGVSVDLDRLGDLHSILENTLEDRDRFRKEIKKVMQECLYYPGRSGEAGGKYIMKRLGVESKEV